MGTFQRTTGAIAALLLAAAPTAAIDIAPSLLAYASEANRAPGSPLIVFDREDWADFLGGETAEYRVPALAAVIEAPAAPAIDSGDSVLTQVWERR
jgi:hypothetical protein